MNMKVLLEWVKNGLSKEKEQDLLKRRKTMLSLKSLIQSNNFLSAISNNLERTTWNLRKFQMALSKCQVVSMTEDAAANRQVVLITTDEMKPPKFNQLNKHYHHQKFNQINPFKHHHTHRICQRNPLLHNQNQHQQLKEKFLQPNQFSNQQDLQHQSNMHLDRALLRNKKLHQFKNKNHSETKRLNQCTKEINFQLTQTKAQMFNYTIKLQLRPNQLNNKQLFLDIKNQKTIASNTLNLNLRRVISFRAD